MSNNGIVYEKYINDAMKMYGLQSENFTPKDYDSEFTHKKINYKLEIKLGLRSDFGQGTVSYDTNNKAWFIGGSDKNDSSKYMKSLLSNQSILERINQYWTVKTPNKFSVPPDTFTEEHGVEDYRTFRSFTVPLKPSTITEYYNANGIFYIQIKNYGLYYMGEDIAGIGASKFSPKDVVARFRIKRYGSEKPYYYRFVAAMRVAELNKSNMSLDKIHKIHT